MPAKLKTKLKQTEFYCVGCRARVKEHPDDICVKVYKNKRMYDGKVPTLKSQCHRCGVNLTKFIKHDATAAMTAKYGKC
jgi:hypothetical protein